jgi:hypothetical protein
MQPKPTFSIFTPPGARPVCPGGGNGKRVTTKTQKKANLAVAKKDTAKVKADREHVAAAHMVKAQAKKQEKLEGQVQKAAARPRCLWLSWLMSWPRGRY